MASTNLDHSNYHPFHHHLNYQPIYAYQQPLDQNNNFIDRTNNQPELKPLSAGAHYRPAPEYGQQQAMKPEPANNQAADCLSLNPMIDRFFVSSPAQQEQQRQPAPRGAQLTLAGGSSSGWSPRSMSSGSLVEAQHQHLMQPGGPVGAGGHEGCDSPTRLKQSYDTDLTPLVSQLADLASRSRLRPCALIWSAPRSNELTNDQLTVLNLYLGSSAAALNRSSTPPHVYILSLPLKPSLPSPSARRLAPRLACFWRPRFRKRRRMISTHLLRLYCPT